MNVYNLTQIEQLFSFHIYLAEVSAFHSFLQRFAFFFICGLWGQKGALWNAITIIIDIFRSCVLNKYRTRIVMCAKDVQCIEDAEFAVAMIEMTAVPILIIIQNLYKFVDLGFLQKLTMISLAAATIQFIITCWFQRFRKKAHAHTSRTN